jgi:hypothetical protein
LPSGRKIKKILLSFEKDFFTPPAGLALWSPTPSAPDGPLPTAAARILARSSKKMPAHFFSAVSLYAVRHFAVGNLFNCALASAGNQAQRFTISF